VIFVIPAEEVKMHSLTVKKSLDISWQIFILFDPEILSLSSEVSFLWFFAEVGYSN